MAQWVEWLSDHWTDVVIPILGFLISYGLGLLLRLFIFRSLAHEPAWNRWRGNKAVTDSVRRPFLDWFLLLGVFIAVQVSVLPAYYMNLTGDIVATLFIISVAWVIILISEKLIMLYASSAKIPRRPTIIFINTARIITIIVALLIILSIWGVPVNPIILAIAVILFILGLALRDAIPNYFMGLQISNVRQFNIGDFIKLESGEAGQVSSMSWQNTQIKTLDGNTIIIPNSKIVRTTLTNYGKPLKKTSNPFRFYTRLHLRELTGLRASNLTDLVGILKEAPDPVVYYHVHRFLEEHLYLTPEPANDFAIWVNTSLGNDILSERLASIDTFSFANIGLVKQRLVDTIEDYLRNYPDDYKSPEGEEFHFIRSVSFILPTPYVAHDLREFVEILRKVTIDSIYFHIYEARMRLQKGTNDFSIWIAESLGEKELAEKIASLDPYIFTLENLRSRIIGLVENNIH
jgi:small-conductance mechanosensitive channel